MSPEDADGLAGHLKHFLTVIARITDLMEDEVINRLISFTQECFQHVLILKETRSDYRLEEKLSAARQIWEVLLNEVEKRADVTIDEGIAAKLRASGQQIRSHSPHLLATTKTLVIAPTAANVAQQEGVIFEVASGFQSLLTALKIGKVSGSASFEYDSIAESLEALRNAVKAGQTQAAVDSAAQIAAELAALKRKAEEEADLEARRRLDESLAGLHDMTARLIGATKDALADPSKNAALGAIVDNMQDQVVQCASVSNKRKSNLRGKLVQAAAELASGIETLADKV